MTRPGRRTEASGRDCWVGRDGHEHVRARSREGIYSLHPKKLIARVCGKWAWDFPLEIDFDFLVRGLQPLRRPGRTSNAVGRVTWCVRLQN